MSIQAAVDNTILLQLLEVHATNDTDPVSSATATCTVKRADTLAVVAGPVSLAAVAGSPGDYEGVLDGTLLDDGVTYWFEFTLDDGPGRHFFRRVRARGYIPS